MKGEIWQVKLKAACSEKKRAANKKGQPQSNKRELVNKKCTELAVLVDDKLIYLDYVKHCLHRLFYPGKKNQSYIESVEVIEKITYLGLTNYDVETDRNFNFKYEPFKNK